MEAERAIRDQPSDAPRVLLIACALCVAFGLYLRVQEFGFPEALTFDEHHFVENARNYLAGAKDQNDHPPLGKLLIATAMHVLGDNSVGWRMTSLLFGFGTLALAFRLGSSLFGDPLAGAIALAFAAIDGFLIAYSRSALLDGMLLWSALASLSVLARERTRLRFLIAGLLLGFACSIKLSGIALLPPILLAALVWRERWLPKLATLASSGGLALAVYYAQYAIGQHITGLPASPAAVIDASIAMIKHHAALTDMTNPLTSYWYTWFLPKRPITMRYDMDEDFIRAMTSLGNPLLWWASELCVAIMLARLAYAALRALPQLRGRSLGALAEAALYPELALCVGWLSFIAPWILSKRDSYIYHYLPSYGIGLVLLGGVAARGFRRWPLAIFALVLIAAEVSVFYAPVWGQLPLSEAAYRLRLFLPNWR